MLLMYEHEWRSAFKLETTANWSQVLKVLRVESKILQIKRCPFSHRQYSHTWGDPIDLVRMEAVATVCPYISMGFCAMIFCCEATACVHGPVQCEQAILVP